LCRAASRIDKERAIHERFAARIEEGLASMARRIEQSTTALDRGVLERQMGRQSRAGLGDSPCTILTESSRIHAADIVLPLTDASKRELRIRCVVRPEVARQLLLDRDCAYRSACASRQ
jgi:hypothetical protein